MENIFRFYIQNKAGLYYFMNGNVVDLTATKTPLNYAPQNWDITQLDWQRGFKYHGIVRKTSTSFEFHKDSASILRSIYYNDGVNGYGKFLIERFNNNLAVQDYELLYDGEINFVSFRSTLYGVKCEIIEGGFLNKLESREDTNYDIDLYTNPNQIWVKMDGINLEFLAKWISPQNEDVNTFFNMSIATSEGVNPSFNLYDMVAFGSPTRFMQNQTSSTQNFVLNFNYYFNVFIPSSTTAGSPYQFHLFYAIVNASSGTLVSTSNIELSTTFQNPGQSRTYIGNVTNNISLPPNCLINIQLKMNTTTGPSGTIFDSAYTATQLGSTLKLSAGVRTPTTYIKCLRPKYVFSELINKIGDNTTTVNSQLLDVNEDKVITSFDSIRNLPNSKLNTNFKDFYESINNIFNTSLSYDKVNDLVLLEEKNYVYDNSNTVLNLGEVSEFEIIPHTTDLFSKLEASYKNFDYDSVNGKDEFNCLNEFLSPLTAVSTSLNLAKTYRADMYGIELTRLNLTGKTVTDGDSDNDIAIVHIGNTIAGQIPPENAGAGQNYYELYRDNTLTITNIYSPQTAFNIFFSPKRCLLRQGDYLRSLLYGNDTQLIKYQISSKNNALGLKMVTDDGVTIIDEGADILISSLNNIIFKPTIFQFKTKVNISLNTIMNTTPYQLCSFTFKNNTYYGFFIKSSLQPAFNETQTFRLLCAPQTDLTNLIY